MAIVYPLTLPSAPGIKQLTMTMANRTAMNSSPFTAEQQVYRWPGQFWKAEIVLPKMPRAAAEPWIATLAALSGQYGTFLLGDPVGAVPRGSVSGSPVVDGSDQSGMTLNIRNLTPDAAGVLLMGDYIQLGSGITARLHKVLTDTDADATGRASLDIWPRLRATPADGETVITDAAVSLFRLAGNENPFDYVSPQMANVRFTAIEAL